MAQVAAEPVETYFMTYTVEFRLTIDQEDDQSALDEAFAILRRDPTQAEISVKLEDEE